MYKYIRKHSDEQEANLLVRVAQSLGLNTDPQFKDRETVFYKHCSCWIWGVGDTDHAREAQEVANIGEMIRHLAGATDIKVKEKKTRTQYAIGCHYCEWDEEVDMLNIYDEVDDLVTDVPFHIVDKIWHEAHRLRHEAKIQN